MSTVPVIGWTPFDQCARPQVELERAVERVRDAEQGVEPRCAASAFEPSHCGLRRSGQLGKLALRERSPNTLLCDSLSKGAVHVAELVWSTEAWHCMHAIIACVL